MIGVQPGSRCTAAVCPDLWRSAHEQINGEQADVAGVVILLVAGCTSGGNNSESQSANTTSGSGAPSGSTTSSPDGVDDSQGVW